MRSTECECGVDLTDLPEYDRLQDKAIECVDCSDGSWNEETGTIVCTECGRAYEITVTASVTIDIEVESEHIEGTGSPEVLFEEGSLQPGVSYNFGGRIYVLDEEGKICEQWSVPTDDQISLEL